MKKAIKLTALALVSLGLSGTALAQSVGADFTVSANVLPSCQISSPSIVFPEVSVLKSGQAVSSASSFQLNCTGAIPYAVKAMPLENGTSTRAPMKKDGVAHPSFNATLYIDSAFTEVFGHDYKGKKITGTSVGGVETINFYAQALNSSPGNIPEGNYVAEFDLVVTF